MSAHPPSITFTATLAGGGMAHIVLPFDPRAVFGRARPPVVVAIAGHTYRSTIAIMAGETFVPLRRAHREAACIGEGEYEVTLTLDTAPRDVAPPADLADALDAAGKREGWAALSYTQRREDAEAVEGAKKPDTRTRRIAAIVARI